MEEYKMGFMQKKVFNVLIDYDGSATRPTICLELFGDVSKKRTTVYDALKKLEKAGLVERKSIRIGTRGRPSVEWSIVLPEVF